MNQCAYDTLQNAVGDLFRHTYLNFNKNIGIESHDFCDTYWSYLYKDEVLYKITMKTKEDMINFINAFNGDLTVGREEEHLYYVNVMKNYRHKTIISNMEKSIV